MSLDVYLHLPFCLSRCRYCAFYSGEPPSRRGELVELLAIEMGLRVKEGRGPVQTVYLGGGTPSLLTPEQVRHLLRAVDRTWGLARAAEVTLEVNPADRLPLESFRNAGVTRVSVGVQSLDAAVLEELGRRHTAAQARRTLAAAVAAGFASVSADLLLGLPDTSPGELSRWVEELVALGAGHLSLYSLELHPGTELSAAAAQGRFRPPAEALEEAQFRAVVRAAEACGLQGYEVSNFALPGHACRHNSATWQGESYLGLGPGAHSFLPGAGPWGTRRWNEPGLDPYLTAVGRGDPPPGGGEELTREQALLERLFLSLRCRTAVAPRELATRFGLDPSGTVATFQALVPKGLFEVLSGGRLRPTWEALRRADGLALGLHERLLGAGPGGAGAGGAGGAGAAPGAA
ncbi:MAG TPA: coproporphyrinogen-III oxidase family protein [Deferrisomatales bacterium]|nr:coproporphyrinogen-III oxidase family protein [Deferrisomatales bacterium]